MQPCYTKTIHSCYLGYVIQAIVNNFVPLLLVTFQAQYHIRLEQATLLLSVNFIVQLLTDLFSSFAIRRAGYRRTVITAHALVIIGFAGLICLPEVLPSPFAGLLASVIVYAVGGGLLEVLLSPIIEALPTESKEQSMSLLHSFYCWGQASFILVSSLFFSVFTVSHWKILACISMILPAVNIVRFAKAPIRQLADHRTHASFKALFASSIFWRFAAVMVCAGACELAASQWASTFAEQQLGITKTAGDLAGPMLFAILMGFSRILYGKWGERINLSHAMFGCGLLCILAYTMIAFSPFPLCGVLGFALCGFSVGILWPGTFSLAAASLRGSGTLLSSLLALAGDLGCSWGPGLVGMVAGSAGNSLRAGMLSAATFPIALTAILLLQTRKYARSLNKQ